MNDFHLPAHSEILPTSISEALPVINQAEEIFPYVQEMRRYFHMHPELSMEEEQTCRRICEELEKMGIPYKIIPPYGVVGYITGERSGKTVALRADMDGLKVQEVNDVPYKSCTPGKMHACGHDAHMAILLGAAKLLMENRSAINGTVKLFFQQGEEVGQGAPRIVEAGEVDDCGAVFGLHQMTSFKVGEVAIRDRAATGNNAIFTVKVKGRGGHASQPHETIDPITATAVMINSLQQMISRESDPAESVVLSVGYVDTSSHSCNVIPDEANFGGTVRFCNPALAPALEESFRRIVSTIAQAHRAEVEIFYQNVAESVYNDPALTRFASKVLESVVGPINVKSGNQWTASEDFWEYQRKAPVMYFWLGAGNDVMTQPLHSPSYDIDESALMWGSAIFYKLAVDYLNSVK